MRKNALNAAFVNVFVQPKPQMCTRRKAATSLNLDVSFAHDALKTALMKEHWP